MGNLPQTKLTGSAEINPYVFRKYDIRGVVENDFSSQFVIWLGKSFGSFIKRRGGKEIALSGDVRLSTPILKENFKKGALSTGVDVIDIGILPTPVNYYSLFKLDVAGSAQITGSHNPPEMNGFKLSYNRGAVFGDQIQELKKIIERRDFENGKGREASFDILNDYIEMIVSKIKIERILKVVMDCGNASACLVAPVLFRKLGVQLTELYCEVDGNFPNHHPDPSVPENLSGLIRVVQAGDYDVGIAYDGDADRIGVVDDKGNIIPADTIMALFLPEIVMSGDPILYDVKCSQALEEEIVRLKGKPVIWKTGHSLIKQKMKELKCKFGGEMSGHIFFADDYFGYDDAIYASARFIQTLSRSNKKLSELVEKLPKYYSTPEIRLNCPNDEEKFKIAEKAVTYFKKHYDCLDLDGVRIRFEDGWGLIRASNTQPVIVCRFEAKNPERREEIQSLIFTKLREFGDVFIENAS